MNKVSNENLKKYFSEEGASLIEAAKKFGVSKQAIYYRCCKYSSIGYKFVWNTKTEKVKKEDIEDLLKKYPDITVVKLASSLNVTRDLIRSSLASFNIKVRTQGQILADKIKKCVEENPDFTMTEIAQELGYIERAHVSKIIRKYNIEYKHKRKFLDHKAVKKFIEKNPDLGVTAVARHFGATTPSIYYIKSKE